MLSKGPGGQTTLAFAPVGGSKTAKSAAGTKTASCMFALAMRTPRRLVLFTSFSDYSYSSASPKTTTTLKPSLKQPTNLPPGLAENLSRPIPSLTANATPQQLAAHIAAIAELKADFIKQLTPEQSELLSTEMTSMGDDWFVALRGDMVVPEFIEVCISF